MFPSSSPSPLGYEQAAGPLGWDYCFDIIFALIHSLSLSDFSLCHFCLMMQTYFYKHKGINLRFILFDILGKIYLFVVGPLSSLVFLIFFMGNLLFSHLDH